MTQLKLYEITDEYKFLLENSYNYETGEVDETSLDRLNDLNVSMEEKCTNIVKVFKILEANANAIEKERKSMQERENSFKNQAKKLKEYISFNMQKCDIKKIECSQFCISLHKNPPKVEVYDENLLSSKYEKIKIEPDISKIKEDLKNGIEVPGAILTNGVNVKIT